MFKKGGFFDKLGRDFDKSLSKQIGLPEGLKLSGLKSENPQKRKAAENALNKVLNPKDEEEAKMEEMMETKTRIAQSIKFIKLTSEEKKEVKEVKEESKEMKVPSSTATIEGLEAAIFQYLAKNRENKKAITEVLCKEHVTTAELSQALFHVKDPDLTKVVVQYFYDANNATAMSGSKIAWTKINFDESNQIQTTAMPGLKIDWTKINFDGDDNVSDLIGDNSDSSDD